MRVNNDFLDMSIPVRSVGPYFYSVVDLGPGVASLCDVNFEQVSNYQIMKLRKLQTSWFQTHTL